MGCKCAIEWQAVSPRDLHEALAKRQRGWHLTLDLAALSTGGAGGGAAIHGVAIGEARVFVAEGTPAREAAVVGH